MNKIRSATMGSLMILGALLALPAVSAQAATLAQNTQIVNTATLSYNDGSGVKQTTASATVLYALVPSIPAITTGPPQTIPYANAASNVNNTFVLSNNSNGKDTFTLTLPALGMTNTATASASITSPASPVTLGGTITIAGSTTTRLIVPFDGTVGAAGNAINGLTNGKSIAIGGNTGYTVGTVVNSASGSYIDFSPAYTVGGVATAVPTGTQVGESITVTVNVVAGTALSATADVVVTKTLKATSTGTGTPSYTSASITDTFTNGNAKLLKYVRNLNGAAGDVASGTISHNSTIYYAKGVPAAPNDKLEYILVASNQAAAGGITVTGASVADVIPTTYVNFLTGVYNGNTSDVMYESETGALSYMSGLFNAGTSTLTVNNLGNAGGVPGSIAPTKSVFVYYQVQVK